MQALAARGATASVRVAAPFRPVVVARPVRIAAPVASRGVQQVVCAAATDAPVAAPAVAAPKTAAAHLRNQRGSVHKVRRVLDVIRGRSYEEALVLLEYMPYRACEKIIKVLMSAAANAKHNEGALKTKLFVAECFADGGRQLKRARPRAQGRAYKILKPTFHVSIRVEERQ